jgi:hypothetical protein
MTIEEYLTSEPFALFEDETLRNLACGAVETFLKENSKVKRSQLSPIPSVIQAGSLSFLEQLVENQKSKNSKEENKKFWLFVSDLLSPTSTLDVSFYKAVENRLGEEGLLQDENSVSEKSQKKRIRRANRDQIKAAIKYCLPVYFEHFNCHYFYKTKQGDQS